MDRKRILASFFVGFLLLISANSAIAAMWDRHCQVAIEGLQQLQQEITTKKQEVDAARVVEAIPSNFISGQLQGAIKDHNKSQVLNEMKNLFHNLELALSELSNSCLKNNRASQ